MAENEDVTVSLHCGPEVTNLEWDLVYGQNCNAEIFRVSQHVLKTLGLGQWQSNNVEIT